MRGRAAAGLPDRDTNASKKQLNEVHRKSARGGHKAPESKTDADDSGTRSLVRNARDRHAKRRIEDREGNSGEKAKLRIGEYEFELYGLKKN